MNANIDLKNAPKQVVDWLDKSAEATGISKESLVLATIFDAVMKPEQKALPAPKDKAPISESDNSKPPGPDGADCKQQRETRGEKEGISPGRLD